MRRYEVIARHKPGGVLTLGDGVTISRRVSVDISGDVTIGGGTIVSEDVVIYTHGHTPGDMRHVRTSPLTIGSGVWIGARAIILPGCSSIGDNATIGAGAVVTHDVPAGELWAGNPARRIR